MSTAKKALREEEDFLGRLSVPLDAYYGIHTQRALTNFPLSGRKIHPELISAYGFVKLAAIQTNRELGFLTIPAQADALETAALEVAEGKWNHQVVVDALQGGAGTSTNMNINEIIANRALEILGEPKGHYKLISPLDTVNLHQSTNDTYPTALKLAALKLLKKLEEAVLGLQEAFQDKEKAFAHIVKVGRTQYQDGVLTTLGREMGAYAEAFNRDRWRVYKCEERLRTVNLGGTAIGTGLGAPRQYIFQVTEKLKNLTGIALARSENLVEATQNNDAFVEVSGILKALASNLIKIAQDLRFLSSGPEAGIGEIHLPPRQAGSSIMPGKVNPVIPEAVIQAGFLVLGNDQVINQAVIAGHLELNAFLPLIADRFLDSLSLLINATVIFRENCVTDIKADEEKCRSYVKNSTAGATALISAIGYSKISEALHAARQSRLSLADYLIKEKILTQEEFEDLTGPEAVNRLGSLPPQTKEG